MRPAETASLESHLKALVGERNPFSSPEALAAAGAYVESHFSACGLEVWRDPVSFEGKEYFNVFGRLEGAHPEEGLLIVGAHFDTVEGTPGADDNASAVAALLEIASCLKDTKPALTILFAGFTLEEYAFVGSEHLCKRLMQEDVPVAGMISLEMLGFVNRTPHSQNYPHYVDPAKYPDTGDFIAVVGNEVSQAMTVSLVESMKQAVPGLGVEFLVVPGDGAAFPEVQLSDHSPFWKGGHKAVMVTDTAFFRNPHYHMPSDTLEMLDLPFLRDVTEGVAAYLVSPQM
ncbi:Peptidase M28 [Nitrospina gracilis 3/211]|uniref:Peptidase M28 n=1 Tax=Nitrospina gracilis (strain 3/211) TaxID=1266370 RepID=M1Z2G2_NITG3|nr:MULTISPECIES: M28 family peptidase [Nitrospina]MCF8722510.1 Zn-dependent M28 family amino/carboxypeptidase [Nitrospina sp. Nb-3]CCQ91941.1 Peptidase M28 [Nitrospina gracilis 3/211]